MTLAEARAVVCEYALIQRHRRFNEAVNTIFAHLDALDGVDPEPEDGEEPGRNYVDQD